MKERFAIIAIAVGIGVFTTSIAFLLFKQSTSGKPRPEITNDTSNDTVVLDNSENKPPEGFFVQVDEPLDESISEKRTIIIKGKTNPGNIVVISSNQEDTSGVAAKNGDFSLSIAIEAGLNTIETRVISPSGEETSDIRTVTFSSEDF